MATPVGAEHRDLQQRFKNVEQKNRELATAVQRRRLTDLTPPAATTAQFTSAAADINQTDKAPGRQAWNTTAHRPVWPVGPDPTDVWVDATGATVHTPA